MTIVEPYIASCYECKTIFRFADSDIEQSHICVEEYICDNLHGYVRCPTCGNPITSWDQSLSTNVNTYGLDILYSNCLQEVMKEFYGDKLTSEEFNQILKLATRKFNDAVMHSK